MIYKDNKDNKYNINKTITINMEQDRFSVKELRKELVDYSDNTINEKRDNKDNIVYYPLGNIYPRGKLPYIFLHDDKTTTKEIFLNNLRGDQIKSAIMYLQVSALKKFIIKNYTNPIFINPFQYLLTTHYSIDKNVEATNEIIKILIDNYDNYDELIKSFYSYCQSVSNENKEYVLDMLFSFLPVDENNMCSICLITEPKIRLFNPCSCKNPIHIDCLIKTLKHKEHNKCSVCLDIIKVNEPIYKTKSGIIVEQELDDIVFFPFQDIYYEPLMKPFLSKYNGMSRLTMAIMFLQVERVKELLKDEEILNELPNYYFGYEGYKQTPLIALAQGNLPSNCHMSFGNNIDKYIKIINMLVKTNKIDINKKDAFDKTYQDYLDKNKYLTKCLKNYNQMIEPIHIIDPIFIGSAMEQVIGRAIRGSHHNNQSV